MNARAMRWLGAAALWMMPACGGSVAHDRAADAGPATQQDAGSPQAPDAAPGDAPDAAAPSTPDAAASPALRIGIAVEGVGASADVATVFFALKVVDAASGAPILDAAVMGGPAGSMIPLVADPSDPGSYGASQTGYSPSWEFSIARGGETVWSLPLTGPSFPAVACTIDWYANPPIMTVDWAPSAEPGVVSAVTITQTVPTPPPYRSPQIWTVQGHDEGKAGPLSLAPGEADLNDRYVIHVGVTAERLFDRGQATIGIASETSSVSCK